MEAIFNRVCFWRNNNSKQEDNFSDDSDDEERKNAYIDPKDITNKLIERFGSDEIHLQNFKELGISTTLKTIGSGAFSIVKKGFSSKYNCEVAIKIIRLDEENNQSYVKKYLPVELKLWTELSEKKPNNLLCLFENLNVNEYLYIVTEVAYHGDLYQCILSGALSESKAKSIFREIVTAVEFCHKNGIAHRDIKPDNLLLGRKDNIKLADFSFVTKDNPVLSQHCGTPGMIAPEQASHGRYNPFKSDIWQLGITLYIMLYKKSPYTESKKRALVIEIESLRNVYKNVPFPRTKMLSLDCKDLIAGMLEMDPDKRLDIFQVKESKWLQINTPYQNTK